MSSVSGLSQHHREQARQIVLSGCYALLKHPSQAHYTMGADRWDAIRHGVTLRDPLPFHGDCSSTDTWLLWLALHHHFSVRDVVNGTDWTHGYTGTMRQHAKLVIHRKNWKIGDQFFYEGPDHVATHIGGGMAFSHGSDAGPFKVHADYRHIVEVRRYI